MLKFLKIRFSEVFKNHLKISKKILNFDKRNILAPIFMLTVPPEHSQAEKRHATSLAR